MRKTKPMITWVVDTREQAPYRFGEPHRREFAAGGTLRYKLDEGDCACELDCKLLPIRIERKAITDYFSVVGRQRERFEAELERLRPFKAYLIIEATADEIAHGIEQSQVSGNAAICSALCWSIKFAITPIFAGSWRIGNAICQRLLEEFAIHYRRKQMSDLNAGLDQIISLAQSLKTPAAGPETVVGTVLSVYGPGPHGENIVTVMPDGGPPKKIYTIEGGMVGPLPLPTVGEHGILAVNPGNTVGDYIFVSWMTS